MDPTVTVALIGGAATLASTAIGVVATRRWRGSEDKRTKAEAEKAKADAEKLTAERKAERLAREQERIDARHEQLLDNLQEENARLRRILSEREKP